MDNFAALITHYLLNFFHSIGMDSVLYLFGLNAYYCAIGIDRFSSIKSLIMCHSVIWLGYSILIAVVVFSVWWIRKYKSKTN